jgi:hypothetical protein
MACKGFFAFCGAALSMAAGLDEAGNLDVINWEIKWAKPAIMRLQALRTLAASSLRHGDLNELYRESL